MKATKATREGSKFVEVTFNTERPIPTGGATYKCLKCGLTKEANAYYEIDHKKMIQHAYNCVKTREEKTVSKEIELYGERNALSEMVHRVKHCVPGGQRLQEAEVLSLAQIALATGLNPFTGELWYIPGKGPMAGIKGLRRRAREQSTYSVDFRAMRNGEIDDHNIKPGDVGRICELFRHDTLARAVEINRTAGAAVVPIKPILGVGIWRTGDQIPKGKSSTWVANKRAEADALRQGFDLTELPYSDQVNGSQLEVADTEAAGWSMVPEEDETMRRKVARNAEGHAQADASAAFVDGTQREAEDYATPYLELPAWVMEIRKAAEAHPRASDPVDNGSFIKQLEVSAGRKVTVEQFKAFAQIVLAHPLEDVTFGEAAVLMDVINADDFEAKVIGLLS